MITLDIGNKEKQKKIVDEICQVIQSRRDRNMLKDLDDIAVTAEMIVEVICHNKEGAEDKGPIILMS